MTIGVKLNATQVDQTTAKIRDMMLDPPWVVHELGHPGFESITYSVEQRPAIALNDSPAAIPSDPVASIRVVDKRTAKFICASKNAEAIVAELMK